MEEKPDYARSSSFARSFFDAGGGNNGDGGGGGGAEQRPTRRQSRRRTSNRARGGDSLEANMAAAAQAAASYDEDEPTSNLPHPHGSDTGGKSDRNSSWVTDALRQGGTGDLSDILKDVANDANGGTGVAGGGQGDEEEEVLEQYRIMAHVEANMRVKKNTGFDLVEYEKRRKMHNDGEPKGDYGAGKKPKALLPEARDVSQMKKQHHKNDHSLLQAEEPPLPELRTHRRLALEKLQQRTGVSGPGASEGSDLYPGVVVKGGTAGSTFAQDENNVRCLGCRSHLKVSIVATLVSCPDCRTVSPASSTRR